VEATRGLLSGATVPKGRLSTLATWYANLRQPISISSKVSNAIHECRKQAVSPTCVGAYFESIRRTCRPPAAVLPGLVTVESAAQLRVGRVPAGSGALLLGRSDEAAPAIADRRRWRA
jgi:hypothetical protein